MSGGAPVWKIWDADNTTEPEATGSERAMCAAADGLARQGVTVILEDPHGRSVFVREVELWLRLAMAKPPLAFPAAGLLTAGTSRRHGTSRAGGR